MTFLFYSSVFLFLGLCFLLCLIVLIQESKSLGLGASFGGDAGESLFGTSTADVVKKFTVWLAVLFVCSCLFLSTWSESLGSKSLEFSLPIEEVEQGVSK